MDTYYRCCIRYNFHGSIITINYTLCHFLPNNKAILDDYYNPNCIRIVFVAVLEYITHQKSGCKIQPLVSPPHSFSHESRVSQPSSSSIVLLLLLLCTRASLTHKFSLLSNADTAKIQFLLWPTLVIIRMPDLSTKSIHAPPTPKTHPLSFKIENDLTQL